MSEEVAQQLPDDPWIDQLLAAAVAEDVGAGDATTAIAVPADLQGRARLVARAAGVVAGLPLLARVYGLLCAEVAVSPCVADGDGVAVGEVVAELAGPAAALLTGERAALNFLQHLSGIATLTARYVAAVAGTGCRVLDTRKTLPGYRALAKYAVRAGGGDNHRLGLYDRIMLKDNHWAAAKTEVARLVARARRDFPELAVEVEVDNLEQLAEVLPLAVEWILLDNFSPQHIVTAVEMRAAAAPAVATRLEASGNIDLANVVDYARAGVDAVSVGRLTHSAPALDLALELELARIDRGQSGLT